MSLFITLEGGEGCGKSSQSRALYRWLKKQNIPVLLIHEPGGTPLSEKIRRLLKRSNAEISPLTELLLFNASRAELVSQVIKPSLKKGITVVCDRFADSTVAYQGYGRGLDLEMVIIANKIASQGLIPDLTILLDAPVKITLARKGENPDRFERESLAFHQRVREGFLKLAAAEPGRFLVVNCNQSKEKVFEVIRKRVQKRIRSAQTT